MGNSSNANSPADAVQAAAVLAEVDARPTIVNITRAARQLDALRAGLARVPLRLGVLASFTFEPIQPALGLQALRAGIGADVYVGPFGRFEQEMIDPASGLAAFKPDVVLLAVRLADVCPALYDSFNSLDGKTASAIVDEWIERLRAAMVTFRQQSSATILVQNYDLPATLALGIADAQAAPSQRAVIARANEALSGLAASMENVRTMDYDALVAQHGRIRWQDPRTAFFARIPVAAEYYWPLAGFYVRHIRPLCGLTKKVIVLDADNTLWGGVVGDVGLDGIALGHDYPGNAFVAFQSRILDLHRRGIVLCIASKNEPGTVEEVLDKHPDVVLRSEHFAAMRVNWQPKPENVKQLAEDLNLGLDSFVFMDDSAVECEMMRTVLPQVLTVHLPEEPAAYAGIVEALDCFDQWSISDVDRQRGQLYKAEVSRRELQTSVLDMPTFYRQLEMRMTLFVDHKPHIARASQMTNRTNQFNMHTIRCTEDDIRGFATDPDVNVFTLVLADRFGDNGVVGLAVVRRSSDEWVLHIFLMSCRVLGRTVEQGFVGWIAERARAAGAKVLVAEFVPTVKNKPFAAFYQDRGFVEAERVGDAQHWRWALDEADTTTPDWLAVSVVDASKESSAP
ncbi:MAG: HAD-IIIC family phosphatase [Planctomycetota bacterium]